MSRRLVPSILALHAALQGVLWWLYFAGGRKGLVGDEQTYWAAAETMARTGRLDLDPLWPPLYPWILAGLRTLPGDPLVWALAAQSLALTAIAWLWWRLGERFTGSSAVGLLGATGLLLYPALVAYGQFLWPEVLHLLLLSLALWFLTSPVLTWGRGLAAGSLLGLALGSKALILGFLPLLLLAPLLSGRLRRWRPAIAMASALALFASPWTPWARAAATPSGGSISLEFNLRLGIDREVGDERDGQSAWGLFQAMEEAEKEGVDRRTFLRQEIHDEIAERGLPAIAWDQLRRQPFRLLDHRTFLHDQLPGGARHGPDRGYRDPPPALATALRVVSSGLYLLILALVPLGLLAWRHRGRGPWWIVPAFLAYNAVLFLALYAISRYRLQMLPFLTLTAALGGAEVWSVLQGRRRLKTWEGVLAVAGSGLLLFWALG